MSEKLLELRELPAFAPDVRLCDVVDLGGICVDQLGRICRTANDFLKAKFDNAYPIDVYASLSVGKPWPATSDSTIVYKAKKGQPQKDV